MFLNKGKWVSANSSDKTVHNLEYRLFQKGPQSRLSLSVSLPGAVAAETCWEFDVATEARREAAVACNSRMGFNNITAAGAVYREFSI